MLNYTSIYVECSSFQVPVKQQESGVSIDKRGVHAAAVMWFLEVKTRCACLKSGLFTPKISSASTYRQIHTPFPDLSEHVGILSLHY